MARNTDIRFHIVSQYPNAPLEHHFNTATQLHKVLVEKQKLFLKSEQPVDVLFSNEFGFGYHYVLESKNKFKLLENTFQFTMNGLEEFIKEMEIYIKALDPICPMFNQIIFPEIENIENAFEGNLDHLNLIAAEVYSTLMRRYNNRNRSGSNNMHSFRRKIKTNLDQEIIVGFFIDNIEFHSGMVKYRLTSDNKFINGAIAGYKTFLIPTENGGKLYQEHTPTTYERLVTKINEDTLDQSVDFNYPSAPMINRFITDIAVLITKQPENLPNSISYHSGPYRFLFNKFTEKNKNWSFNFSTFIDETQLSNEETFSVNDLIKTNKNVIDKNPVILKHPHLFFGKFCSKGDGENIRNWVNKCTADYQITGLVHGGEETFPNLDYKGRFVCTLHYAYVVGRFYHRPVVSIGKDLHCSVSDFEIKLSEKPEVTVPTPKKPGLISRIKSLIFS